MNDKQVVMVIKTVIAICDNLKEDKDPGNFIVLSIHC